MSADSKQEGGRHYKNCPPEFQHWNLVVVHNWSYFQAQAIKYIMRYKDKNGVEDLKKAQHFIEKMIEVYTPSTPPPTIEQISGITDIMRGVKPTGWVGFVFEGATKDVFLYTCTRCGAKVETKENESPPGVHGACAGPGYVNQ